MPELLLKRRKGSECPPAEVIELQVESSLIFQTAHKSDPCLVDLTLFASGITTDEIVQRKGAGKLMLPFRGRPQFISELLPHLYNTLRYAPSITCMGWISSLRWWWRLLDSCHDHAPVIRVRDLNPIHYAAYRINPCSDGYASMFFRIVNEARQAQQLPILFWTAISRPQKPVNLVRHEDVAKLYTHFQQKCKTILISYEYNESILPSRPDLHALYLMFIILTGWNPAVVLNIDVNETNPDGSLRCIMQDVQNPLYSVINSVKERARGKVQQAHGLNKQRISCINIVKTLYRQTAAVRFNMRTELTHLEKRQTGIRTHKILVTRAEAEALIRDIAVLKAKIKSPWIYKGRGGKISVLKVADISGGKDRPLDVAIAYINSRLVPGEKLIGKGVKLTDFRDAFISYRWHKGGYSWLATMMAAGHTSLASLNAYLNKRQHYQMSQKSFLKITEATWETIDQLPSRGARLMPTVIAAKVKSVPDEQVRRWLAGKDITMQGVGCRDLKNPPPSSAPTHKPGSNCRPQRCLLCPTHAILLPESYLHIGKRLVELRYIQTTMSTLAWIESDYPLELANVESALSLYDEEEVVKVCEYWSEEIRSARHIPLRMEGTYA